MHVYLLWLAWPVFGIILGLIYANYNYKMHPNGSLFSANRDVEAAATFGITVVLFPLVLAGSVMYFIVYGGKWLILRTITQLLPVLPAYRQEQQQKHTKEQQAHTEVLRKQIDDMHAKMGIPPVDWSDKTKEGTE